MPVGSAVSLKSLKAIAREALSAAAGPESEVVVEHAAAVNVMEPATAARTARRSACQLVLFGVCELCGSAAFPA
ncbi:MAG TPA: hypothetical protein DCQ04_15460, partial [Actinobacteria bacterium]|nr:hypothetical protein [Actinomycetota bacterium]